LRKSSTTPLAGMTHCLKMAMSWDLDEISQALQRYSKKIKSVIVINAIVFRNLVKHASAGWALSQTTSDSKFVAFF
jgi:hypothetical protein